ncbi:hypothetical protein [Rubeoparvulum massiliense]|uniref:hypothetical protein n=1 Tax=Rubeoparvulum massiliense TaxID=1631346 RepID=UPI00065DBD93|nr:hypothetical protein [Rubeoparvulum massiliense]
MPNEETLMQKVVTIEDLNKYLSGDRKPVISGFVTKAQDTIHLRSYDEIREGLRLDYAFDGGYCPFPEGGNTYGIIRFKTNVPVEIPRTKEFGGNEVIWINEYGRQPFTGNGFTKSENIIIPEYIISKSNKSIPIEAEFYMVIDGEPKLVAILKNEQLIIIK